MSIILRVSQHLAMNRRARPLIIGVLQVVLDYECDILHKK